MTDKAHRPPAARADLGTDSDAYAARAEVRRRKGMWGGVTESHEELDELDLEFWLAVDPVERVRAAVVLQEDVRKLRNDAPFPRLPGSSGGVRRVGS